MQTLERHDIAKLEGYIKNIKQYRKDLKYRGWELLESHEPENFGASKSGGPGNPIERETIKKFGDKKYMLLDNIVSSVDKLVNTVDDEALEIMQLKYWNKEAGDYTWQDVANEMYMTTSSINRRRDKWLQLLAEYMDYV
ncbi:transcriptional regulator [Staphylococcus succinus]|uniref:transcriptional regulator n=1 Tax=Staphylococcus succinus TaxID=61015 RepID=UPI00301C78D0